MKEKKFAVADGLYGKEIKQLRAQLQITQAELADLICVSKKTIERWETSDTLITGPIVTVAKLLLKHPKLVDELTVPEKIYPLRMWYMKGQDICTVIDVDERLQRLAVYNYTNDIMCRAFGAVEEPTFEQYKEFLESRCFPRSRDKMKLELKALDLPFYEPIMIIEKTQGRMAEDDFWIQIDR